LREKAGGKRSPEEGGDFVFRRFLKKKRSRPKKGGPSQSPGPRKKKNLRSPAEKNGEDMSGRGERNGGKKRKKSLTWGQSNYCVKEQ